MKQLSIRALIHMLTCTSICTPLMADDFVATKEKLETALTMDHRSTESRDRDQNRNPLAAMEFCQLRDDMTVIEFGPGSGWYT